MSEGSHIQWTHNTENFWRGCSKVHVGCANCYAENHFSCRLHGVQWGTERQGGVRKIAAPGTWQEPFRWNRRANRDGQRPRVFCMSLGDIFEKWSAPVVDHNDEPLFRDVRWCGSIEQKRSDGYLPRNDARGANFVPATLDDFRRDAFQVIQHCSHLDWLLLTKHGLWHGAEQIVESWPHRCTKCGESTHWNAECSCADASCRGPIEPIKLPHVWLLGSVSDQVTANRIVQQLHCIKQLDLCRYVGLSVEPIVGPIELQPCWNWLDWLILGGESTQSGNCRRLDIEWIRQLVSQSRQMGISCFVKQLGSEAGEQDVAGNWSRRRTSDSKGGNPQDWPPEIRVRQFPNGETAL
jgi:protein gp37